MSDDSCAAAAGRVSELLGAGRMLDALVNNAGVGLQTSVGADAVLETNLRGCKRVFDTFLPLLRQDGGRVVNLGSGARLRHSASLWLGKKFLSLLAELAANRRTQARARRLSSPWA
jgi:NAD(P)-dependent dehydrogenase (short-subunit alcohol dehydrogenase family)